MALKRNQRNADPLYHPSIACQSVELLELCRHPHRELDRSFGSAFARGLDFDIDGDWPESYRSGMGLVASTKNHLCRFYFRFGMNLSDRQVIHHVTGEVLGS